MLKVVLQQGSIQSDKQHFMLAASPPSIALIHSVLLYIVNPICRFYKLVWGAHGMSDKTSPSGLLLGGAEQGQLYVWDADKIISGEDSMVHKFTKHTGPVATLDINRFQVGRLSSLSPSEVYSFAAV